MSLPVSEINTKRFTVSSWPLMPASTGMKSALTRTMSAPA